MILLSDGSHFSGGMFLDGNDDTFHWGDQIMYKTSIFEGEDGTVRLWVAPSFSKLDTPKTFAVYCCMAGIRRDEITVRVDHLQNGSNVIVMEGQGAERPGAANTVYEHKVFRGTFTLPNNVDIGSRSEHFHEGLLMVSFSKVSI